MQPDMGGVWRQEVLRQIREAALAESMRRPTPRPAPPGWITERLRVAVAWCRGRLRRGPVSAAPAAPTGVHPAIGAEPVGLWEDAVRSCEQALAARPDLVGLWVGLSLAAGRMGDLEIAEGAYEVAGVLSPGEAEAWRDALQRDFPEIHLPETVECELAAPDEFATRGNGR
jgi:cytochrome c-type biogenesis protein CcmH/NrfG